MDIIGGGDNMKHSNSLIALILGNLLGFLIFIPACKVDSPVSFQDNSVTASEPKYIALPKLQSLAKLAADTALITPELGGRLQVDVKYHYLDSVGLIQVLHASLSLTFPPYAVMDTLVATMSLDDQVLRSTVDLTFGPHGSVFLKPAVLDVDVTGLVLSGLSSKDTVYLWYKDGATWVKMEAKRVDINATSGHLKCQDGELPHFSAYAFGR